MEQYHINNLSQNTRVLARSQRSRCILFQKAQRVIDLFSSLSPAHNLCRTARCYSVWLYITNHHTMRTNYCTGTNLCRHCNTTPGSKPCSTSNTYYPAFLIDNLFAGIQQSNFTESGNQYLRTNVYIPCSNQSAIAANISTFLKSYPAAGSVQPCARDILSGFEMVTNRPKITPVPHLLKSLGYNFLRSRNPRAPGHQRKKEYKRSAIISFRPFCLYISRILFHQQVHHVRQDYHFQHRRHFQSAGRHEWLPARQYAHYLQ